MLRQEADVGISSDAIAGILSFAFLLIIISIYFPLDSSLDIYEHYIWFSSLLLLGLYHQELLYAIFFHAKSH